MTYRLVYDQETQKEAKSIFEFYEEKSPSLGNSFFKDLDEAFGRIKNNPFIYQKIKKETRRALLK